MTLYSLKKYKKKNLNSKRKKYIGGYPIVTDNHYPLFFYITVSAYNAIDENGNIDENSEITNIDEINRVFYADDEKWEVNSYYSKDDRKKTLGLIDQFTDLINNQIKEDFEDLSELKIDFINEIFFDLPGLIKVKSFVKDNNPEDDLENINDAFNQISEKNLWQYLFTNDLNYVKYNDVYYKLTSIMTIDEYQNQFWEEHFDEQSKKYFYYNSFSKKSQWEKPENCPIKDRE
jgi:hypothetical protein